MGKSELLSYERIETVKWKKKGRNEERNQERNKGRDRERKREREECVKVEGEKASGSSKGRKRGQMRKNCALR